MTLSFGWQTGVFPSLHNNDSKLYTWIVSLLFQPFLSVPRTGSYDIERHSRPEETMLINFFNRRGSDGGYQWDIYISVPDMWAKPLPFSACRFE